MPRFASVLLVDPEGRLLLQERDEHAAIDPDCWGLPGGHLDAGEDAETAAYRELGEETGVELTRGTLRHVTTLHVFHDHYGTTDPVDVFLAGVDLTDADIECHEGRRIVFIEPSALPGLRLTRSAAAALPDVLTSDLYRKLATR